VSGLKFTLALAAFALLPLGGGTAQAQRKSKAPPPPLDASFPPAVAACGTAYSAALAQTVRPANDADAAKADAAIRVPVSSWPGRWLFADPAGQKPTKAQILDAAEARTKERICTERVQRAGRVKCAQWEAKPVAADGPPPVAAKPAAAPPLADDELRTAKQLNGFVTSKGLMIEFGRNGRMELTMRRPLDSIAAYVGQPAHPALCNGAPEMLEFLEDRMEPLRERFKSFADVASRSRTLAVERVAKLLDTPPADWSVRPMADLAAAVAKAMPPLDAPAAPQRDALATLRGLADAGKSAAWTAEPPEKQIAAALALRAVEAAVYADALELRGQAVERSLFAPVGRVRDAHKAHCTCSE
jgi:hypothetical protein